MITPGLLLLYRLGRFFAPRNFGHTLFFFFLFKAPQARVRNIGLDRWLWVLSPFLFFFFFSFRTWTCQLSRGNGLCHVVLRIVYKACRLGLVLSLTLILSIHRPLAFLLSFVCLIGYRAVADKNIVSKFAVPFVSLTRQRRACTTPTSSSICGRRPASRPVFPAVKFRGLLQLGGITLH